MLLHPVPLCLEPVGRLMLSPVPLCLGTRGYGAAEVLCGCIYILRGLKVVQAEKWSHEDDKYMPRLDGARSLDCTFRTAVEDVSEVKSITQLFGW